MHWAKTQYQKKNYIFLILGMMIYVASVAWFTFIGSKVQRYRVFNRTKGQKSLRIFSIWSSPEESQSAGPALVKRALQEAKQAGVSSISVNLYKQSPHVKWFKKCSHGGFDAVFMMKSLNSQSNDQERASELAIA